MKIAVVGMPQSGSTALFNIITGIFEAIGARYESYLYAPRGHARINSTDHRLVADSTFLEYADRVWNEHANTVIIKEHHYDEFLKEWADLVFLSKRDIRDSIASRRRRGKMLNSKGKKLLGEHSYDASSFEGFKEWCSYLVNDCYLDWLPADYEFSYERYVEKPEAVVSNVACLLNIGMPEENAIVNALDNLTEEKDGINFYSADKRTAGGKVNNFRDQLNKQEIDYIDRAYPEWIEVI